MRFAIWNLDLVIRDFTFFKRCFFFEQVIKKSILLDYFRDSGKRNFCIRDPLFFPFVNRARDPPVQPSLKEKVIPKSVYFWSSPIKSPGGGGTPLYGLYRYVPRNRVWFLEVLDP